MLSSWLSRNTCPPIKGENFLRETGKHNKRDGAGSAQNILYSGNSNPGSQLSRESIDACADCWEGDGAYALMICQLQTSLIGRG